jgi:hypothetical protein
LTLDLLQRGGDRVPLEVRAAEHERGLRARLRREALLEQVLRLLGLDAGDREVVLERAAGGDRAADAADEPDQHEERGDPRPAGSRGGNEREQGGHGREPYAD